MTNIYPQQKKKILADPAGLFKRHFPQVSGQQVATLHALAQQYTELERQHKDVKDKTRKLSRLIGTAKKNGANVDDLMASIRYHSKHLKALADELADTGNHILGYFECVDNAQSNEDKPATTSLREYPDKATDCPGICVSLENTVRDDWNRYVEANPAASIYHRVEWKGLIKKAFGHASHYFTARNSDGEIVGILPLIRLNSRLFGDFLVSMPYFNYGGAIADSEAIEHLLINTANEHAQRLGVNHVEYRDNIPRKGLPGRSDKVNMVLELPGNTNLLWQNFPSKLRSQIKRSLRENLEVQHGREQYLDDFYSVFARNMRDLGTPVYSKTFFRNILHQFPEYSSVIILRMNGRPVSAAFLLG